MPVYRLPFDLDGLWKGGANWDDPNGGHPAFQAYAFDFGHPEFGKVRAARGGRVAFVQNIAGNTNLDSTVPPGGTAMWIRHADDTVALYAHLRFQSTQFEQGDLVLQGAVIGLSGNTGNSSGPHLHFEVRSFWIDEGNRGPTIPIQFERLPHSSWRPKNGDLLLSNNTVHRQEQWRWCSKCQGIFFGGEPVDGAPGGTCPAGGLHDAGGSGNYAMVLNSNAPGQPGWRWCKKCQGMFFSKHPGSKCPAGGAHSKIGSGNYILHTSTAQAEQANWRWCKKCQGLFFAANSGSKCPAGGAHTKAGSGNYALARMGSGEVQSDWRSCEKCLGMFFAGMSPSTCPSGGEHSAGASANYVLVHDYAPGNAPGQPNWRWCHKCMGLFFAGNPGSRCPAGAFHSGKRSGNYTLVVDAPDSPGEHGWRWCSKCQGLYSGAPGSRCPAGGRHTRVSSGNYSILQ